MAPGKKIIAGLGAIGLLIIILEPEMINLIIGRNRIASVLAWACVILILVLFQRFSERRVQMQEKNLRRFTDGLLFIFCVLAFSGMLMFAIAPNETDKVMTAIGNFAQNALSYAKFVVLPLLVLLGIGYGVHHTRASHTNG